MKDELTPDPDPRLKPFPVTNLKDQSGPVSDTRRQSTPTTDRRDKPVSESEPGLRPVSTTPPRNQSTPVSDTRCQSVPTTDRKDRVFLESNPRLRLEVSLRYGDQFLRSVCLWRMVWRTGLFKQPNPDVRPFNDRPERLTHGDDHPYITVTVLGTSLTTSELVKKRRSTGVHQIRTATGVTRDTVPCLDLEDPTRNLATNFDL